MESLDLHIEAHQALDHLSKGEKIVVTLFIMGFSFEDISDEFDIPFDDVILVFRSAMTKARILLMGSQGVSH